MKFRFSLRILMAVVAVFAGLAFAAVMLSQRAHAARLVAAEHRKLVEEFSVLTTNCGRSEEAYQAGLREESRRERLAAYHEMLALKYERVTRYPWLPVALYAPSPE